MNLAGFQIKPVLRDKWEAVDLGIALARRWYVPLLVSWIVPAALVFLPLILLFPEKSWIAGLVFWWLKPLYDRVPLFLLSRYIFSEEFKFSNARKELFSALRFSLFSALTWRRLDYQRSFSLAVILLERQSGAAFSRRISLLQRNCGSAPFWVTIVMVHVEALLCVSLAALVFLFVPEGIEIDYLDIYYSEPLVVELIYYVLYFVSAALVAPFYVACGFSLYLNRRIELEAWDIEIAFRQSVLERQEKAKQHRLAGSLNCLLVALVVGGFGLFGTPELVAEDGHGSAGLGSEELLFEDAQESEFVQYQAVPGSQAEQSRNEVLDILTSPPFVIEQQEKTWDWRNADRQQDEDEVPQWFINFVEFIEKLFGVDGLAESIAVFLEVSLWVLVVILVLAILYRFRSHIRTYWQSVVGEKPPTGEFAKPETIMGMEITETSLPDDIPAEAKSLWANGKIREALALLYRGSLYELVYSHDIELAEWFTERECYSAVQRTSGKTLVNYFLRLTTTWQELAYGHRQPVEQKFEWLCHNWKATFQHA